MTMQKLVVVIIVVSPVLAAYFLRDYLTFWRAPSTNQSKMNSAAKARAVAAVVGAVVADAAAMPVHWIYNNTALDKALEGYTNPEFREPSAAFFYTIPVGRTSAYGDQAVVLLESLVASNGVNLEDYAERMYKFFGPKSEYETEGNLNSGRKLPITGPWRPLIMKKFIPKYEEKQPVLGSESQIDMHAVAVVPPLVAKYAGQPDLLDKVKSVIEVTMLHEENIAIGLAAARLLEDYILNGPSDNAIKKLIDALKKEDRKLASPKDAEIVENLEQVFKITEKSNTEAAVHFGKSCNLPDAFQTSIHAILTQPDYTSGVRATILAGGDNASRAGMIGACMAAQGGLDSIRDEWKAKTLHYQQVLDLATKLVK
ncbi:crystallin J1A-like [Glandiceps talaboti]